MKSLSGTATPRQSKELAYVRKGLFLAALTGVIFCWDGIVLKKGLVAEPFNAPALWLLAPLFAAGFHDFSAAIMSVVINFKQGKIREIGRTLCSKPGRLCILGACFGAPLGMGGYLMSLSLAGPAYTLPITTLYPAMAAVLARIFLKERISFRGACGLALCVIGAFTIGWTPPPGGESGPAFYAGIAFAFLAAFGWAAEGVCVTSGMDFIEPGLALNVYQIISTLLYFTIIIPIAYTSLVLRGVGIQAPVELAGAFLGSPALIFFALAGFIGCLSYRCWYAGMNMTGVSRAMALNVTYALWGVLFSALFTEVTITTNLVLGALGIFTGIILVVGNPREMVNLRTPAMA
ncbi:DMT family transporter [Desulfovibrio intestinalis]|uniref:Drug/metabolite transporter (DMT)-like permease n=1 Tax=Desulfovibrio intestinalis TaxID=58621 RepID=A0A7W8C4A8_9BACT|nr:DMT family transporter [Desulfovibrio intestinalis]MBB5144192.1 drug/metabolite transporter (DMT)-like permease [Desulfovibrio intestinalis]